GCRGERQDHDSARDRGGSPALTHRQRALRTLASLAGASHGRAEARNRQGGRLVLGTGTPLRRFASSRRSGPAPAAGGPGDFPRPPHPIPGAPRPRPPPPDPGGTPPDAAGGPRGSPPRTTPPPPPPPTPPPPPSAPPAPH